MRLVYLALGWVSGIVLAASNPNLSSRLALAWLALCGLALLSAWLLRDWQRWPALALLAFTLGGLRMALVPAGSELALYNNQGGVSIEGVVSAAPEQRDSGEQLRVTADTLIQGGTRNPVSGVVLVQSAQGMSVRHGDRVRATGLLLRPWHMTISRGASSWRAAAYSASCTRRRYRCWPLARALPCPLH